MSDAFSDPTHLEIRVDLENVLRLLARHLYTDSGAVIREIIQNSYDSIIQRALFEPHPPSGIIRILTDHVNGTVIINDNGAGYTQNGIQEYLVTIGRSGTAEFREKIIKMGIEAEPALAPRFGIGLLAAFIIAQKIEVETLSVETPDLAWYWTSEKQGSYLLQQGTRQLIGTTITLHISADHRNLLESEEWHKIIRKYSDFIPVPIYLNDEVVPANTVNAPWHLWFASENERLSSYWLFVNKHFLDYPLEIIPIELKNSNKVDGVLYIPNQFSANPDIIGGIDIYYRRQFVISNYGYLLPEWAQFVRGIIDSPDLKPTMARDNITLDDHVNEIRDAIGDLLVRHLKKMFDFNNLIFQRLPSKTQLLFASSSPIVKPVVKQGTHPERIATQETQAKKEKMEVIGEEEVYPIKHIICMVALPFKDNLTFPYETVLLPALRNVLERAPYYWQVVRADERYFEDVVERNVAAWIKYAHAYIADISDLNPNVMMELGYMRWGRKSWQPVVLLARTGTDQHLADLGGIIRAFYPDVRGDHAIEDITKALELEFSKKEDIQKLNETKHDHYLSPLLLQDAFGVKDELARALSRAYTTMENFVSTDMKDVNRRAIGFPRHMVRGLKEAIADLLKKLT